MNDGDVLDRQGNRWLQTYGALIRMSPLLWPLWWPLMCAYGITADRQETARATERLALGVRHSATVIDLAAWRGRRAHQASTRGMIDGAA
jgi:hypothetical protein